MENALKTGYALNPGVQVRKETFGLLFYASWGPRLFFVPTKNWVPDSFFSGNCCIESLIDFVSAQTLRPRAEIRDWMQTLIGQLSRKGLIHEQRIC